MKVGGWRFVILGSLSPFVKYISILCMKEKLVTLPKMENAASFPGA
jgi:hypothetical protein